VGADSPGIAFDHGPAGYGPAVRNYRCSRHTPTRVVAVLLASAAPLAVTLAAGLPSAGASGPAAAASSAPAAVTAAPFTGGWVTMLGNGTTVVNGTPTQVSASGAGSSVTFAFTFSGAGTTQSVSTTLGPPPGQTLTTGVTYSTGKGATMSNGGQTCVGTFELDALSAPASTGAISSLAIQFERTCGSTHAIAGEVALNLPNDGGVGYYLYLQDGALVGYGNNSYLTYLGNLGLATLNKPIVTAAATPDGGGYWMAAGDGGIFAYGDAGFYGSMGGKPLNKPIVGMTSTADGEGYWEVASDGGMFAFGDAAFYGSMGGKPLNKPIVGIASTPDGKG
jgi:hypothetical protein